MDKTLIVVLAGGNGTRLFPISTKDTPKQYVKSLTNDSDLCLAELTLERAQKIESGLNNNSEILYIGNEAHREHILPIIDNYKAYFKFEDEPLGTAMAITYAVEFGSTLGFKNTLILPADHYVSSDFTDEIVSIIKNKSNNAISLFGIDKDNVSHAKGKSQYGWIRKTEDNLVEFKEKPDYIPENKDGFYGNWVVNSGMFLFNNEMFLHELNMLSEDKEELCSYFTKNKVSIDTGLIEKLSSTDKLELVYLQCKWTDLGTFESLFAHYGNAETVKDKFKEYFLTGNEMSVKLLSVSKNPIDILYSSARQCYSAGSVADNYPYDNVSLDKKITLIRDCVQSGHMSVLEHVNFTFAIKNVSRVLTHQLVRHRHSSPSQQSQRYVDFSNFTPETFIVPDKISKNRSAALEYNKILKRLCSDINEFALKFKESDILTEDIRYLLPNATASNIVVTMNCSALFNFFRERLCLRAQKEIRDLAALMYKLCYNELKDIFELAGPHCKMLGYCNQGKKRTCGKKKLKEDILCEKK